MVLSNKKLKQKLREAKAESLTAEAASVSGSRTDPSSELHELLEAAKKQRPKLSKREKRRKVQSLLGSEGETRGPRSGNGEEVGAGGEGSTNGEESGVGSSVGGEMKEKKRKRVEGLESEEKLVEGANGKVKEAKKAKKNKNKNKKDKKEEEGVEGEGAEVNIDTGKSQIDEVVSTKVYVGGIPYYSTEDDIRSYFEGCGTITEIDCMNFTDSGKFRGIAIISFKTDAAAKRALALDGSDMGGFYLQIKPYQTIRSNKVSNFAPEFVEGYNRIYVGNLSWDVTEDDLKKFFSGCNVSSIRFGIDKETGDFRGYAHIDFLDSLSVAMALKLDQRVVLGRPIKISCAVPKKGAKITPVIVPATEITPVVVPAGHEFEDGKASTGNGKMRRRTCYECGEKGHISTDCPKKQTAFDPAELVIS